jgi:hypothetical protein
MARRLPLEAALTFAGNVRRDRFHDPDAVFVVDDLDGSVVNEAVAATAVADPVRASAAPSPPTEQASPRAAGRTTQRAPCDGRAPTTAGGPCTDRIELLLARARQGHAAMRSELENNGRLLREQQQTAQLLRRRTQELWREVETLHTTMRSRREDTEAQLLRA